VRFTSTLGPLRERLGVAAPEPLTLDALTDAVIGLIGDDTVTARAVVLRGGRPPRWLSPEEAR
jgi:hypothetical protein